MNLDHYQVIVERANPVHDFLSKLPGLRLTTITGGYFEVHGERGAFSVYEAASLYESVGITVSPTHGGIIIQIGVSDIFTFVAPLKSLGVAGPLEPIATPWGTRSIYFSGPSDLRFEIYSWN